MKPLFLVALAGLLAGCATGNGRVDLYYKSNTAVTSTGDATLEGSVEGGATVTPNITTP
ncbi:MAG: hypothetical protein HC840_01145 [Leptolyngbyaceae cyanobacterium RM2_2_4]|nr:hypothetical protein [Leptolyngbyaceae cyanobacterium RM2_2_4]